MGYAVTGDREQALALLSRRTTPGSIPAPVRADPLFDGVRSDARFQALVNRGLMEGGVTGDPRLVRPVRTRCTEPCLSPVR